MKEYFSSCCKGESAMSSSRESRKARAGFLFTVPALLFIFMVLLFPLGYSFYLSLCNYNVLYDTSPTFIGLENYIQAFQDPLFLRSIGTTFIFAGASLVLGVLVPLVLALFLSALSRRRLADLHETLIYLPVIIPVSLGCLIFSLLLEPSLGYTNYFITHFLGRNPFIWTQDGHTALATLILISQWQLGYQVVILSASLRGVDKELLEAATIDGANEIQKMLFIKIPEIQASISVVTIFALIKGFKTFVQPMVMTLGGPDHATETIYFRLFRTGFSLHQMGYASSMAYILSVLIILASLMSFKAFKVD